jgi:hypothetical protein
MKMIYKQVEEQSVAERLAAELPHLESVESIEVRFEKYHSSFAVYVIFRCGDKFTFEIRDSLRPKARAIVRSMQPNADVFLRFP